MEIPDIPRSATNKTEAGERVSRPLSAWAGLDAFVLLAEPGGGKSRAFLHEARASASRYVKARDFANVGVQGWCGETLFIDGLDEMRADASSRNTPLDDIVKRLADLGRPRFRLSCREADWLLAVDQPALRAVAPNGALGVLHLNPLSYEEIIELLCRHADRIPDPREFVEEAKRRSVDAMLRNPLLLNLLVEAVGGDKWPDGRQQVFERACERMAGEHDAAIAAAHASRLPSVDDDVDAAGFICAVMLLSGADAVVTGPGPVDSRSAVALEALRSALPIEVITAVLSSKLFLADDTRRTYRHRSIAEYLAARALADRTTKHGLPMARVSALMCAPDGGVVEPLRGLNAWLSVTCPLHRSTPIERDPLGCVLYGDAHALSRDDKINLLRALKKEADGFPWFRRDNWVSYPFGPLSTPDMAGEFAAILTSEDRSLSHQALLECVAEAIEHGGPQPTLIKQLESVFRDGRYDDAVRRAALDAWLAQPAASIERVREWLDDVRAGLIEDRQDELRGRLLDYGYPSMLSPSAVMAHLRTPKVANFLGAYRHFWLSKVVDRTLEIDRPFLADALASLREAHPTLSESRELQSTIARIVVSALNASGDREPVDRIARWLAIGTNRDGSVVLLGDDADPIREWLALHPEIQKQLLAWEYSRLRPDAGSGPFHFWRCEERLYRAKRPRDWYRWLLQHASGLDSEPLVKYLVSNAAAAALDRAEDFDITMDEVEAWVQRNEPRWPDAPTWLESAWSWLLNDSRGDEHRRLLADRTERASENSRRRAQVAESLEALCSGRALPGQMHDLTLVYGGRCIDFHGDTPEVRVQQFLAGDLDEARRAIGGIEAVLRRSDISTAEQILALKFDEQQVLLLGDPCLVAADLAQSRDAQAFSKWSDDLVRSLVAFRLTNGTDQGESWYSELAKHRPRLVADVLLPFAERCLLERSGESNTGLWPLARDDGYRDLSRMIVPSLLERFPARARPRQLRRLNTELLPAAVRHLLPDDLKRLARQRLAMPCLDSGQRASWLLASLRFSAHRSSGDLMRLVAASGVRTDRLVDTFYAQSDHAMPLPRLPSVVCSRFIELLGPGASPTRKAGAHWVGPRDHRRDVVRSMIDRLSGSTDEGSLVEIDRLRQLPRLRAWQASLDAGRYDHLRTIRADRFEHASANAVIAALSGAAPANAQDLAALVMQHLSDVEKRIRGDESNILRPFWREGAKQGLRPQVENACRDQLRALLQPVLASGGVLLNKEAQHANDTRADLRAESLVDGRWRVVPVEIKREDHKEVWSAWQHQLDGRYTTHQAADGVGTYLVLWFGHRPRPHPVAGTPKDAPDMERCLRDLIPIADRARLSVRVLDLSRAQRPTRKKSKGNLRGQNAA